MLAASVPAARVDERERALEAHRLDDLERLGEVVLRLAGEPDDHVGAEREIRHGSPQCLHQAEVAVTVVRSTHTLQDPRRARLQRHVDVLADTGALDDRRDHGLAEVLRMRAREADSLDSLDGVTRPQELAEVGSELWARSTPTVTFCPRSVISRTPSRASVLTSATISPGRRLCSRPRTAGTMQYAHFELQPIDTCTQAWHERSRWWGKSAAKCSWVPKRPAGTPKPPRRSSRRDAGSSPVRTQRRRTGTARRSARAVLPHSTPTAITRSGRSRFLAGAFPIRREARIRLLADRARVEHHHVGGVGRHRLSRLSDSSMPLIRSES